MFIEISEMKTFEILRNNKERTNYFLSQCAKIIAMTSTHASIKRKEFQTIGLEFDTVIFEEAGQILEIESFIAMNLQKNRFDSKKLRLKRIIMLGDDSQLSPIIKSITLQRVSGFDQSLFKRFLRLEVPSILLKDQGRSRESILALFQWKYPFLKSLDCVKVNEGIESPYNYHNVGILHEYQFINVEDYQGKGESQPSPFFYQNLAEAEFIVSFYMYLCLKGVDPNSVTILTTYNGQKFLIRDIIHQKCSWNSLFKKPYKITTVDKYQGQQNDIVLLSLVRTRNIGHIRDPRRLVVAMSRARLGFYVFGRFSVFCNFPEIKETFELFKKKGLVLQLLPEERKPCRRKIGQKNTMNRVSVRDFKEMYKIIEGLIEIN